MILGAIPRGSAEPIQGAAAVPAEVEANLRYLKAELARIDVRIRRQVRRWQLAGQDPADSFRGLHLSDAEAGLLSERPFGVSWGQTTTLPSHEAESFAQAEARAAYEVQQLAEAARQQGYVLRLEYLAATFGLDRFDLDCLLICLAPALDLRYERLYAYLQDDVTRKRPTVSLVLDLAADGSNTEERLPLLLRFAGDAPLLRQQLLERVSDSASDPSLLGQALGVDPAIVAWLLGGYQPHAGLSPHASLWLPPPEQNSRDKSAADENTDILLAGQAWPQIEQALAAQGSVQEPPVVVFYGPDVIGQQAGARLLAARTGRPLLTIDLTAAAAGTVGPLPAMRLALRDARLTRAIPCLAGWDTCLALGGESMDGPGRGTTEGGSPPPDLLAELCDYPGLAIVSGRVAWQASGVDRDRILAWIEFPAPAYAERRALWQHFLRRHGSQISDLDLSTLAGQFHLTTSQIRDAVTSARDWASQHGEGLHSSSLLAAARAHSNPRLAAMARKIVPRYGWSDIVLPDDQLALLHEIVATVRGRSLVLEEWGVGRKLAPSPGVTMLFSGPPGTGKTMAAEVIAAELSLDLYKIDLSTIVSKYIGETEKNLERIFSEAQSSNAILFFDEADAIFGKRSEVKDAHDRYANIEISYLLQRMEAYDGVTILATNLRANLDEAFTRRLQFAVDMPFPDEGYRQRIWQTLLPQGVPREPDLDLQLLARRFKLAGGNIRNILVGAAYLAAADGGRLGMKHLLHSTRRELQKMGRLVNEKDLAAR
jgi:Winged helix domain, variant/ATPase family associated with various cellular activities (AAA)